MWCHDDVIWSRSFLNPTMVIRWHALWCVWIIDCYCFLVPCVKLRCFEWFDLDDVMLWHVWLGYFGVFGQYYFEILSGCLLRNDAYCRLSFNIFQLLIKTIVNSMIIFLVLSSYSWRINVNIMVYLRCFPVTCIWLRWFYMILWFMIWWAWPN